MNNQQHPFINALGGNPSNIHILDNMFIQQADQGGHKTTIIPQYATAYQEISNAMTHHHAMNLVATPVHTVASTIDAAALYQNEQAQQQAASQQQQQPISYKVPQAVAVVEQPVQMSISIPERKKPINTMPPHVKDIVAEAMREVEESNQKKQQAAAVAAAQQRQQQEQQILAQRQVTVATIPQVTHATAIAIKSEPHLSAEIPQQHHILQQQQPQIQQQILLEEPRDVKPNIAAVNAASGAISKGEPPKPTPTSTPKPGTSGATPTSQTQTRTYNRSQPRTQIMPRLQLLDDEDDGLTCRLCLQAFWYRHNLNEHLQEAHSITDPSKYEREEREKKLRRIREEQQRIAMSKRQRLMQMSGRGGLVRGRGGMVAGRGGVRGGLRPGMPGGRPMPTGPRPSFQYRDGAFICDLCKKSFSDGNDMVAHWKSHVKQQAKSMRGSAAAAAAAAAAEQKRSLKHGKKKIKGKDKTHLSSRGRPISKKSAGRKGKKKTRKDKGKPRWTAYLLWSTRRRKEIAQENPEYTFAQVGKSISEGWKEVEKGKIDQLKEEAEHLNSKNIKKLPKIKEGTGSDEMTDYSEEEDPSFDETNLKKPISERVARQMPERKSGRKQKRPSFFQEFEEEEDNLDKILDDFELEQIEEAKNPDAKPKPKPTPKNPGSRPRKRKEPEEKLEDDEEIELETSRSGRVRKKTKFYDYFNKEGGEEGVSGSDESEDDDFNPEIEGEDEEPEEEYADLPEPKSGSESEAEAGGDLTLPPKKRGRPIATQEGDAVVTEDNADNVNASKLSHEKKKRINSEGEEVSEEELVEEEKHKKEEPKVESETAKEAKEHGLSDEKEAMAAMALPLEETEDVVAPDEKEPEDEKEPTKATLDDVSLQTPRPEAPIEEKEEITAEDDNAVVEDDSAVVEDDNAGGLDGSVTEETPNDENPLGDNEEAILTSATEKMEEGDEQYKNELAESQMDNIFN